MSELTQRAEQNLGKDDKLKSSVTKGSVPTSKDLMITDITLIGGIWSNALSLWRKACDMPGPWENLVLPEVLTLGHPGTESISLVTPPFCQ